MKSVFGGISAQRIVESSLFNPGHNIFEFFNIIEMFLLTTSKAVLAIYPEKDNTRVAEQLKT